MKFSFVRATEVFHRHRRESSVGEEAAPARFHVLLLEDEGSPSAMISQALRNRLACRVSFAKSKFDPLSQVDVDPPELLLLSAYLRDDSNLKICEAFKRIEGMERIPVLVLLDEWNAPLRAAAFRSGAVDCIKVPFYPTELIAKVQLHIDFKHEREDLLQQIREQEQLLQTLRSDI